MKNKVSLLRASVPCAKECSTFLVVGGRKIKIKKEISIYTSL